MSDSDRTAHKGGEPASGYPLPANPVCPQCVDKGLTWYGAPRDVAHDERCVMCHRTGAQLEMVGLLRRLESGDADNEDRDAAIILLLGHALG